MNIFRFRKDANKHRYRIHVTAIENLIGDVWAKDERQARKIGDRLDIADLQPICTQGVCITSIHQVDDADEEFLPFSPLN